MTKFTQYISRLVEACQNRYNITEDKNVIDYSEEAKNNIIIQFEGLSWILPIECLVSYDTELFGGIWVLKSLQLDLSSFKKDKKRLKDMLYRIGREYADIVEISIREDNHTKIYKTVWEGEYNNKYQKTSISNNIVTIKWDY